MRRVPLAAMTGWQFVCWLLAYTLLYATLALVGAGVGVAVIVAVTQSLA